MTSRILHGDLRQRIPELIADGVMVDAIVCDPPYELTAKRPGGRSEATRGAVMGGFMGMKWDGTGIAFDPEAWALCLQILKPGGYMLTFGGTRTHHRVMCAIEDAGFELRDVLMWVYGNGFPKSKNHPDEHPGMGTALKPAWEPIILARKPMPGTVLENMNMHGVGMLNIDACRIEHIDEDDRQAAFPGGKTTSRGSGTLAGGGQRKGERTEFKTYADRGGTDFAATPGPRGGDPKGRWPANLIHDGSDEVVALFPSEAGAFAPVRGTEPTANGFSGAVKFSGMIDRVEYLHTFHGDSGSAARFFYAAKASREDRNEGCGHLERKPLNWSSGTQSPGTFQAEGTDRTSPNHHPTVKPTDLMRWLCRLVTPPKGLILDPFTGSGSTGKAAALEGFDFIGIELDAEYVEIATARIAFGEAERKMTTSQQELCI